MPVRSLTQSVLRWPRPEQVLEEAHHSQVQLEQSYSQLLLDSLELIISFTTKMGLSKSLQRMLVVLLYLLRFSEIQMEEQTVRSLKSLKIQRVQRRQTFLEGLPLQDGPPLLSKPNMR
jgi:hypothetical protein